MSEAGDREPGSLLARVHARTREALASGALLPIETRCETLHDGGFDFRVRVVSSLARKEASDDAQRRTGRNPFLPYEESLFVADLGPTHVALLNKFNVFEHHVLIVTRAFEDQLQPLGRDDLRALARVLVEIDGLGFYNAGEVAGASQRHKHLQLVALPLDPETPRPPVEARLLGDLGVGEGTEVASLPFAHAAVRLSDAAASDPERLARELGAAYATGLAVLDLDPGAPGPYNLLATRRWLLLVPRTRERWRGISINALGFAGSLLVREAAALARLRAAGPLAALCAVAPPRSGGSRPAPRA